MEAAIPAVLHDLGGGECKKTGGSTDGHDAGITGEARLLLRVLNNVDLHHRCSVHHPLRPLKRLVIGPCGKDLGGKGMKQQQWVAG